MKIVLWTVRCTKSSLQTIRSKYWDKNRRNFELKSGSAYHFSRVFGKTRGGPSKRPRCGNL